MKPPKYDADYFIKKFEAEPEESWATGIFVDSKGRMCAMGKMGVGANGDSPPHVAAKVDDLIRLFRLRDLSITGINDGTISVSDLRLCGACQKTPKQRILAALRWIKEREVEK